MDLNLPFYQQLADCRNLLIAGMGGGFDLFCGLPIYFELVRRGQQVHLANLSLADIENCSHGIRLSDTLVGVTGEYSGAVIYFPEFYLARWFRETRNQAVPIWCFHNTGAQPLLENYRTLTEHLEIDAVLLVDGGVDSLMRGDEAEMGTLLEDSISLFAVNALEQLSFRTMACIGMGAELGVTHAHVLENIAALVQKGGFMGICSLTPQMASYQAYEEALLHVQAQKYQDASVINSSIVSAVRGHYGNYHLTKKTAGSQLWISPLMPIYWFFDLPVVAGQNLYLSQLEGTRTLMEALEIFMMCSRFIPKRAPERIPIS